MGKLAVYKYIGFMFLIVTVIMSAFTLFGLYGGDSDPTHNTISALLVYLLPVLIIGDAILLLYWVVRRRWHWALIPFVTILCCIPYIRTIWQTGWFSTHEEGQPGIKIATYNVAMFGRETSGFKSEDILSEMKSHQVDILCLQEYNEFSGDKDNTVSYKEYFPYCEKGQQDMIIFSRYPITATKNIPFEYTNNSAMWADVNVEGKTLRVFNVHLETTGINRTLHQAGKMQARGVQIENNRLFEAIFGNYTFGMIVRAGQANMMAMEMRESEHPILLCGDFNDVPYSYVYNTMKGDLVDGFQECGKGFMQTYRGKKPVRIDYLFHDKTLKGLNYYKTDINYSDHVPVFMIVAL